MLRAVVLLSMIWPCLVMAGPDQAQLSVWANEAIVATYTFNAQNFLARQKAIAKYFSAKGWIAYSKALQDTKIPDLVQKNGYEVSAVALLPPVIKATGTSSWQAKMPLLVLYKNSNQQQKQTLDVVLSFSAAEPGLGVRGLSVQSLVSTVTQAPCQCAVAPRLKAMV